MVSHLTRTACPLAHNALDLSIIRKFTTIRFLNTFADLINLPFVQFNVFTDGLRSEERTCTTGGFGKLIELFLKLGIEPKREY